jgi:hypothetical protein
MTSNPPRRLLSDVLRRKAAVPAPTIQPPAKLKPVLRPAGTANTGAGLSSSSSIRTAAGGADLFRENESLVSYSDFFPYGEIPLTPSGTIAPIRRAPHIAGANMTTNASSTWFGQQPTKAWSERGRLWALYKPPFVPMKAKHADPQNAERAQNSETVQVTHRFYSHGVSVEGYLHRTLKPYPVTDQPIQLTIPYEVDDRYSGLVTVIVSTGVRDDIRFSWSETLRAGLILCYDMLLHGHIPKFSSLEIPQSILYPHKDLDDENIWKIRNHHSAFEGAADSARGLQPTALCSVKRHAYYGPYPVTLVTLQIINPPSAHPPRLRSLLAMKELNAHVVGDPDTYAFGAPVVAGAGNHTLTAGTFPRVMVHLRKAQVYNTLEGPIDEEHKSQADPNRLSDFALLANFNCSGGIAHHSMLSTEPMPRSVITINDGRWTPLQ